MARGATNDRPLRCRCGLERGAAGGSGPLRVNNGDAMMPALSAGTGVGILPEFFLREALEYNQLERLLPDWSIPPWRCLLGNVVRGTATEACRGSREFSGREAR